MIRFELDSIKVGNSRTNRVFATVDGTTFAVTGPGNIEAALARNLVKAGKSGDVEVYRDGTPVFLPYPLEKWAITEVDVAKRKLGPAKRRAGEAQ